MRGVNKASPIVLVTQKRNWRDGCIGFSMHSCTDVSHATAVCRPSELDCWREKYGVKDQRVKCTRDPPSTKLVDLATTCYLLVQNSMILPRLAYGSVHLTYQPYFFSEETMFFSHNKLANSTFQCDFSAKRTGFMIPSCRVGVHHLPNRSQLCNLLSAIWMHTSSSVLDSVGNSLDYRPAALFRNAELLAVLISLPITSKNTNCLVCIRNS